MGGSLGFVFLCYAIAQMRSTVFSYFADAMYDNSDGSVICFDSVAT